MGDMNRIRWAYQWWLPLLAVQVLVMSESLEPCMKRMTLARAEQIDKNGRRCWDNVKVSSCGGRCDSREVSDWEFPFKISHHPVCVYGSRRKILVNLRHCDPGVEPDTEKFTFLAADDCRCQICSSKHISCEWLPFNSTILQGINYKNTVQDD
ncbi:thyrostimulin beta-5 subunit-like [Amyelois transitella]|uniref:thyrostimulin beta-5 subunit-like n=1 Tax=Amyelois transitella TaxID=680683 RepID=UPI00067E1F7D|nr:thyrostimulin beta-5 subunit-like [Amyelois transitella]